MTTDSRPTREELLAWIEKLKTDSAMVWALMLRGDIARPVALIERESEVVSWEWQPIETAPKDHILWLYDQPNRVHYVGWWYPGGGEKGEGCFAYEGESIGFSRRRQPTHWMLPTVPPASR